MLDWIYILNFDRFERGDSFVMEFTGFYEPIYDAIESKGFEIKLANP
jgi:hypothetical protein